LPFLGAAGIDAAIEKAHRAFLEWRLRPAEERVAGASKEDACHIADRILSAGCFRIAATTGARGAALEPAAGGLAVAMDAVLKARGGLWFGWKDRRGERVRHRSCRRHFYQRCTRPRLGRNPSRIAADRKFSVPI
jgi:trehalose-6-phosphate synthase